MLHFFINVLIWLLLSVFSGATKDVSHVGCFNTTSIIPSIHGTVVKPLTWEICVHLCLNKVTMYAGIQLRNHSCFCGNDLCQRSAEVGQSHCQPCPEDSAHWCGGDDTVSLYQLKPTGSSPLAILLATDGGISMVVTDNNSNSSETLQLSKTNTTSVAYHYKNQEIFFISKNKIMRLSYMPLLMKYIHPLVIIENYCNDLSDLDLNWEHNFIYWACASNKEAWRADLEGSSDHKVFFNASGLKYLVVEPYARLIFFTRSNALSKYDYSIFKDHILDEEYKFKNVLQLAIDIQQEIIYVIGSYTDNNKRYLVSLNYDCTVFKVIYQGAELYNPCGLAALNGTIFWCRMVNNKYILYRGKISSKGHLDNVTAIFTGTQKINDLKIYHPGVQSPSTDYLCHRKKCSHGCSATSSVLVQCTCPSSTRTNITTVLANDSRTCLDIPNYKLYPQTTDLSTSTTESVTSFAEDPMSSAEYSSTDYTIGNEDFEIWSKTEESSTVDSNITPMLSEHYTPRSSQSSKIISTQEASSHLLYIISCGFILMLVVVIPFQVYLAVWTRKTNSTFRHLIFYNRPSELVELT